jgi:hypothetical protein
MVTFQTSSILLITSHNTLLRYEISSNLAHAPTLIQELHCEERPLLWSACFSQAHYGVKEDVHVAVGTIMNEILVWRPFLDEGRTERRFIGHHVRLAMAISLPFDAFVEPDKLYILFRDQSSLSLSPLHLLKILNTV